MTDDALRIGAFGISVSLPPAVIGSLKERFRRNTLFGGPCMIIDRRFGLALDATTAPRNRTRPVLWTPHGAPWQQWRFHRTGRGMVKIVSEHGGRVLTTDASANDGSWVWLESDRDKDSQRWRAIPTDDRLAFLIETKNSEHALDTTLEAVVPSALPDGSTDTPTPPILWSSHWAPWQQWMILRLPLS